MLVAALGRLAWTSWGESVLKGQCHDTGLSLVLSSAFAMRVNPAEEWLCVGLVGIVYRFLSLDEADDVGPSFVGMRRCALGMCREVASSAVTELGPR